MVSLAEGEACVRLARTTLDTCLRWSPERDPAEVLEGQTVPPLWEERRGVFVTLHEYPSEDLRGCIGFPEPIFPLRLGLPRATLYAAREDPRFPPVRSSELAHVVVEVSLLTPPELLRWKTPEELLAQVRVGQDGLTLSDGAGAHGLLLPQVPTEQGWDASNFLDQTCVKAGLAPQTWRHRRLTVQRFQSEIFAEAKPRGAIVARSPAATSVTPGPATGRG